MAKLRNLERRVQVFNLPHEIMCKDKPLPEAPAPDASEEAQAAYDKALADYKCNCDKAVVSTTETSPSGDVGIRHVEKIIPKSITILARETVDVADKVLEVPEVQAAVRAGALRVLDAPKAIASGEAPEERRGRRGSSLFGNKE